MTAERELPRGVIDAFAKLDTPSISDAMDKLGVPCGLLGIRPMVSGVKLCGQAFTVHYTACGQAKGTVGDFIDDILPGEVAVLDNGGRVDCTVWGDIMSLYASQRHIAGTVIDGVCRDLPVIRELRYPIFTRGHYMVTGKDRVYADRVNEPISVAGNQVCPGDLLVGDDSGVIVVPFKMAEHVLQVAQEIETVEQAIVARISAGMSLREARAELKYHTLQTRDQNA